jgi:hypothetical protein
MVSASSSAKNRNSRVVVPLPIKVQPHEFAPTYKPVDSHREPSQLRGSSCNGTVRMMSSRILTGRSEAY